MRVLAIIPSRLGSTRLPEKALCPILGKPLLQHVWEGAAAALREGVIEDLLIATDSPRIAEAAHRFGGKAVMTAENHPTGSDRIWEVARLHPWADLVVNIQGDEPLVNAEVVRALLAPFSKPACQMSTLKKRITRPDELENPNVVKVVTDLGGRALYFSRATLPFDRDRKGGAVFRHLGYYAFRRDFLGTYVALARTPLEQCEMLEQLRVLEHGYPIHVAETAIETVDVNTAEDIPRAETLLRQREKN